MAKPNPLDIIASNTYLPLCSVLARGAVHTFVMAYYRAGCPPLDKPDYLATIGMRGCDWMRHEKDILIVLNDILPKLRTWQLDKQQKYGVNRDKAIMMTQIRINRVNARRKQTVTLSDSNDTHTEIIPVSAPRRDFREGQTDRVEREKIITSKRPAAPATLKDS